MYNGQIQIVAVNDYLHLWPLVAANTMIAKSSFHWIKLASCCLDNVPMIQACWKYALKPDIPDASVDW